MSSLRIGLVGPDQTQPCGIADYTARLRGALAEKCDLAFVPFREALLSGSLAGCRAILVQYERTLLPDPDFLRKLAERHPGRVHVVPHEVFAEDPFAFPYAELRSAFLPALWLKRLRYRWTHRGYAREKRRQADAYGAHRVIPLSGPGADILRSAAGERIMDPVPHAFFNPPESGAADPEAPSRAGLFPAEVKSVIGIFGFLNPGLDYAAALDLIAALGGSAGLLILGGPRTSAAGQGGGPLSGPFTARQSGPIGKWLAEEAEGRGLEGRVRVTGYVPESALAPHLRLCDMFLAPLRFKSNSGSLLHLVGMGRPILASDLPLTRYLRDQGAPLELYSGPGDLLEKARRALRPDHAVPPNRYPWSFPAVADAYLRILGSTPQP
jgi:glycosyltransferase involved in cell wall biosynthesis